MRSVTLQRSKRAPAGTPAARRALVHEVLRAGGRPLEPAVRREMESRFAHDFGRVRVHTDAAAASSADAVGALAYAVGRDVVFAGGSYAPATESGRRLLTHELAHVVQQDGGPVSADLRVAEPSGSSEREAQAAADGTGRVSHHAPVALARQPNGGTSPTAAWGPELLTITLSSDQEDCLGMASPTSMSPYDCSVVPPFCQSARVPFEVAFYVDRASRPRRPDPPPTVRARFVFTTTGGNITYNRDETDSAPRYVGANVPLEPRFGRFFTVGTTESGRLDILLELRDPLGTVVYTDRIDFVIRPCV